MHIAARAEVSARAGDDHGRDVACVGQAAKQIPQLRVAFECQRVLAFRSVEGNGRDLPRHVPLKMGCFVFGGLECLHVRLPCPMEALIRLIVNPPETLSVCPVM